MVEEESQTEPITSRDCWTQWPPHDMKGYGKSVYVCVCVCVCLCVC